MTFQTETEKFSREPIAVCTIELDDGNQYLAKVDIAESSNFYDGYIKSFGAISRTVAGTNSNFKTSDCTITCINIELSFSPLFYFPFHLVKKKIRNKLLVIKLNLNCLIQEIQE